jgi:hypothetical protein
MIHNPAAVFLVAAGACCMRRSRHARFIMWPQDHESIRPGFLSTLATTETNWEAVYGF